MAAKITKDGLWRVSYGELPGLTPEEVRSHIAVLRVVGRTTADEIRKDATGSPKTRSVQTHELFALQDAPALCREIQSRPLSSSGRRRPSLQSVGRSRTNRRHCRCWEFGRLSGWNISR